MPTLILKGSDVRELINMKETVEAVEKAFKDLAEGRANMPAKIYLILDKGDFRAMPASLPGAAGLKWVTVYPGNPPRGLPTVMGTIIYNDPETGYPLALMDGTDITAYRTGAAAAVAAKYLAKKNSQTLGLIGAGRQAQTQLLAHLAVFDIKLIKVYDQFPEATSRFLKIFSGYPVEARSIEDTADADILCTVTPARGPVVKKEWIKPGTHIGAIGADAPGKEELDPSILNMAKVVVDDMEQAVHGGEVNVPISQGLYNAGKIHASLADIVSGRKPGRTSEREITVFDSTGLAIEDIAVARILYERAKEKGGYLTLDFI